VNFDSHMHVGSFESIFGASLDRDGIDRSMQEKEISNFGIEDEAEAVAA